LPPIEVLLEIAAAGAVSAGLLALLWRWRRAAWPAAVAVGAGYATADGLARSLPDLVPTDSTRLLLHFAVAGALAGVLETSERVPRAVRLGVRALLSFGSVALLLRGLAEPPATWVIAALGAGVLALWSALAWRARHVEGFALPLLLFLPAAAGAKALEYVQSGVLGQLSGALSAALAPCIAMAFWNRTVARGMVPVAVLTSTGLWLSGHYFSFVVLPAASVALLALAPLAAVRRHRWAGVVAALLAVGLAVVIADAAAPEPAPDDPYADYFK